jgi:hypothetical protein
MYIRYTVLRFTVGSVAIERMAILTLWRESQEADENGLWIVISCVSCLESFFDLLQNMGMKPIFGPAVG